MQEVAPGRRRNMQANRSRDTSPELAVRRLLHASGFRFRVNYRPQRALRRTADIVFTKARIAVFIDGCFWHSCAQHASVPRTNVEYWGPKLARNRDRDRETTDLLQREGWIVLRFWEHEAPDVVANSIIDRVVLARQTG
ncbi:very short patch repair endonuclease [Diaminobutyricimonas sp. TR449]|uniref:very short patch repair endonuclease n=1 Tax=Diaminobutyricimonas sp. TR449 TaxID=2708076 RepID=UPI0024442656|nr:very short patch repair endonuclease [Diaminobutyricimonas sp. TR449]